MRILLVTSGIIGHIGGVERFVISYSRWAVDHGNNVTIVSRSVLFPRVTRGAAVPESLGWKSVAFTKPILNLFGLIMFVILGVPLIIRENRKIKFEVVFAQDTSFGGLAASLAAKFLKVPVAVYSHGLVFEQLGIGGSAVTRPLRLLFKEFQKGLDYWIGKRVFVLIAVSEQTARYFRTFIPLNRLKVVSFGLDPVFLDKARALRQVNKVDQLKNGTKIGFIGRLSREKNVATLIQAFEQINCTNEKISLLLVGSGPNEGELKNMVNGSSKEITFLGARSDIDRIFWQIDIFALPSLTEGNPVSLMEAMSFGKPIVASDIPSISSMVENGKEALLVPPLSVDGWKNTLSKLAFDSTLQRELGEAAIKRIERINSDNQFQRLWDILSTCVSS